MEEPGRVYVGKGIAIALFDCRTWSVYLLSKKLKRIL